MWRELNVEESSEIIFELSGCFLLSSRFWWWGILRDKGTLVSLRIALHTYVVDGEKWRCLSSNSRWFCVTLGKNHERSKAKHQALFRSVQSTRKVKLHPIFFFPQCLNISLIYTNASNAETLNLGDRDQWVNQVLLKPISGWGCFESGMNSQVLRLVLMYPLGIHTSHVHIAVSSL